MSFSPEANHARRLRRAAYDAANRARVFCARQPHARRHVSKFLKGIGGGIGYATLIEPRWVQCTQVDVEVTGLPRAMDGYKILHLTDIHYNLIQGDAFLDRVLERAAALDADVAALTGDFITHNPARMQPCLDRLKNLRLPDGVFAVRGNHDAPVPLERAAEMMDRAGIRLLENEHALVTASRHRSRKIAAAEDRADLVMAGVGDLWTGFCSPGQALAGADRTTPTVLLSHNPGVTSILPDSLRVDLMLSGHTHGGQVRPFQRSLKLFSGGEQRFVSGLAHHNGTAVYVSRGVGTSALHVRWNCRPEIALVVLRRREKD